MLYQDMLNIIGTVCAVGSLVVTIVIGVVQNFQSRRMERFERAQSENNLAAVQRDEQRAKLDEARYLELVDARARAFIAEYHETIGLLPLCGIAMVYDPCRPYSRKMYRDFCHLERDVRVRIFDMQHWYMCDVQSDDFFDDCYSKLRSTVQARFPGDDFLLLFYDHGKYIERAILDWSDSRVPNGGIELCDRIGDVLFEEREKQQSGEMGAPCRRVRADSVLYPTMSSELDACHTVCSLAKLLPMYMADGGCWSESLQCGLPEGVDAGSPGAWHRECIETMEDLFLCVLFKIWSNIW